MSNATDHRYSVVDPQKLSRSEVAKMANDVRLACMRISRRIRFESTGAIAPHQFSVLARLEERTELSPGQLAEIERVRPPSMSKTVASLVETGLIERSVNPHDGRQIRLRLTPVGRTTLRGVRKDRDEWMISRVSALTPQEQMLLREAAAVLAKVAAQ